ncbi:hypothetical protein [Robiginitalea sediminis]|uniref:hypothetical protein n=1 Tax=Robiginitalea sediminis TaxID=1982593 RepID=UPI000B4B35DD|nr:hypothetical protein [Robiginitalea sediminis]
MLHRLLFNLRARNRHGTHSPFVYRFLDKALYTKSYKGLPPDKKLLLAAADHFRVQRAGPEPHSGLAQWLARERPGILWEGPPYDLFLSQTLEDIPGPGTWHPDGFLYAGGQHASEKREKWQVLLAGGTFRVVVETHAAALLFFRPQQAREHFRIRI